MDRDTEDDMALPAGKTCNDCKRFNFCSELIGEVNGNAFCDWAPSRFIEAAVPVGDK